MDGGDKNSGLSDGTFFALAIILFLLALIGFYVAFHPNGIRDPAFITTDGNNPNGLAENPAEVIVYFMNKFAGGQHA